MNKPRMLVLPLSHRDCGWENQTVRFGNNQYTIDTVNRMELTLADCECIIANIPTIVDFIVRERHAATIGPDGLPIKEGT